MLGEGIDLIVLKVPKSLADLSLGETGIGARIGLTVTAIPKSGRITTNPTADTVLDPESELLMIGKTEQRDKFIAAFGM